MQGRIQTHNLQTHAKLQNNRGVSPAQPAADNRTGRDGSPARQPSSRRRHSFISATSNSSHGCMFRKQQPPSVEPSAAAGDARHALIIHDKTADAEELKINARFFPELRLGELIEIAPLDRAPDATNRLLLRVEQLAPHKGNFHLSLSSQLADLFQIRRHARQDVSVRVVAPESVALSFAEISFKDQHISRADMWRLKAALLGQLVYRTKVMNVCGKVQVDECLMGGVAVKNGVITHDTKLIFRSRSARLFWLVQVSEEMWDFADDGTLYCEKAVNMFMKVCDMYCPLLEDFLPYTLTLFCVQYRYFIVSLNPTDALREVARNASESYCFHYFLFAHVL
jgi:hypothetical protein